MNILVQFYAYLQLRDAVKKADKAHKEEGGRYYVMPNAYGKVRLVVTDRKNFRRMRMKHYIDSSVHIAEVQKLCFYYTASRKEDDGLSEAGRRNKIQKYFVWFDARRRRMREERCLRRKGLK